jgi:hypothetical protein
MLLHNSRLAASCPAACAGSSTRDCGVVFAHPCRASGSTAQAVDVDVSSAGTDSQFNSSSSSGSGDTYLDTLSAGSLHSSTNGQLVRQQRRPGTAGATPPRYNPLTHTWAEPVDAATMDKWQRQVDKGSCGRRPCSAGGSMSSGKDSAERDTVASLLRQQSSTASRQNSMTRPATAGGHKPQQRAGDSWCVGLLWPCSCCQCSTMRQGLALQERDFAVLKFTTQALACVPHMMFVLAVQGYV